MNNGPAATEEGGNLAEALPFAVQPRRLGPLVRTQRMLPAGMDAALLRIGHARLDAFADQLERELIVERTKAGLASARARGRNGGRPFKMTTGKLRLAQAAMGQPGTKIGELCVELGVSRQTLYRHMTPTGQLRPDGEKLLGRKRGSRSDGTEKSIQKGDGGARTLRSLVV